MRSKILDALMANGEQKTLALYDDYVNGRITINECIKQTNIVVEETQKKYQAEVARILTIEEYYSK